MTQEIDVLMGEPDEEVQSLVENFPITDPDEYFAKSAFRIVYQTNNFFLPQLRDLIDRGEVLNIRPEYQRRLRWNVSQKSKLIESLLLNIPVPPVFLYESDAARYEVMDGQQRLNAVREFLAGEFALSSLEVLAPLNGLRYYSCPPRIKRALDRASISAVVLLLESESSKHPGYADLRDIRRFIFDRLNTGGTKLNAQEIRNALNPGEFNRLIIDLTRYDLFTKTFDIPEYIESDPSEYYENAKRQKNTLYASMGDCQLVLRYFALKDEGNIRGSMKAMLDRAMRLQITTHERQKLEAEYKERFAFLYELFDGRPFALPEDENGRQRVSAAMYDASMVAIDVLWPFRDDILQDKQGVLERLYKAHQDPALSHVLTGQGNTAKSIKERIDLLKNIFRQE
ncbi:DUF262 domain-containing protein [Pseudomonas guariconensis]|uniref:DUF262 domain-containing protein n=1 Tax=Pseudomonas guariconensis TaxID=1288410 RepID=UPI00366FAFFA